MDDGNDGFGQGEESPRQTYLQRRAVKGLAKQARKRHGEPLTSEDWEAYFAFGMHASVRAGKRFMRAMPSTPRCGFCGAPFAGVGARILGPLGYRPSRKNPSICATCVEMAPPGGMTTDLGVLFADMRGFTSHSESITPAAASVMLRKFYAAAEKVLFPEALIDKLIGDEVMALYLPFVVKGEMKLDPATDGQVVAPVMLAHARALLEHIGYGTADGPMFEVGIGLEYGEAFVGNIGDTAVHDFTAVGDVVNTASRLQSHAAGGEVVASARLVAMLDEPVGVPEELDVKGKEHPVAAYRIRWF